MGLNDLKLVTMDKRMCPFLDRSCLGSDCSLWMRYDRADGVVFEACTFVLQTILQEQTILEAMRSQASTDKVATEVAGGFSGLLALATQRRALASRAEDE